MIIVVVAEEVKNLREIHELDSYIGTFFRTHTLACTHTLLHTLSTSSSLPSPLRRRRLRRPRPRTAPHDHRRRCHGRRIRRRRGRRARRRRCRRPRYSHRRRRRHGVTAFLQPELKADRVKRQSNTS